jgi:hypothetical protein
VIREHRAIIKALELKYRKRALHAVHYHLAATERCLQEMDRPSAG